MKKVNLAIIGATGAVGQEILKILKERNFPYGELKLLASKRSAGKEIVYEGKTYIVEETTEDSFDGVDIALFAGGPASKLYARVAQEKGVIVIDNSSNFRLADDVPLIVPEVNADDLKSHKGLIANPNCSTTIMVAALSPLHKYANIKRIIVSTYQAVSGAGIEAIDELTEQTKQVLEGKDVKAEVFQHQIAFNLIPHIDVWVEDDYSKEEVKMIYETQKIFCKKDMAITATTVRVPVYRSHSESIYIETEKYVGPEKAKELLQGAAGVVLCDNPQENKYPMPLDVTDKDEVYVGRVRKDLYVENGLNLWVASDQLRKGAATNTVQIAEELIKQNLI